MRLNRRNLLRRCTRSLRRTGRKLGRRFSSRFIAVGCTAYAPLKEHDLRGVCIEREALQEKLEALYKAVFDGPTPCTFSTRWLFSVSKSSHFVAFPQEDDLERILQQAQDANDREQARFVADLHVVNLLSDALDRIDAAVKAIASARGNSVNGALVIAVLTRSSCCPRHSWVGRAVYQRTRGDH